MMTTGNKLYFATITSIVAVVVLFVLGILATRPKVEKPITVDRGRQVLYVTYMEERGAWNFDGGSRFREQRVIEVHIVTDTLVQKMLLFKDMQHLLWWLEQMDEYYDIRMEQQIKTEVK